MHDRLKLAWYNNVLRHWRNRRLLRMWLAAEGEPDRPKFCPRAGRMSLETLHWAREAAARVEADRHAPST